MAARNPAFARYLRRIVPLAVGYLASVAFASWILPKNAPADALTVALALVPGLAAIGWLWAMARLLIELEDEYLRMLEVRKMIVATGFALAVSSVWGLLELFSPEIPRLPVFYIFPIWCVGLAIGSVFNKLSIGDAGNCP